MKPNTTKSMIDACIHHMNLSKSKNSCLKIDFPYIQVILTIPRNFPGISKNSREFLTPGNENFVPESSSLYGGLTRTRARERARCRDKKIDRQAESNPNYRTLLLS